MGTAFRIYPPIGIARLGNSPDEFFVGPESPGHGFVPAPNGQYRDVQQRIRRQGARFRIYECQFDEATPELLTAVREITAAEATIEWSVHLANNKATRSGLNTSTVPRSLLEIDGGSTPISGVNQSVSVADDITITDNNGQNQTANVKLGDLKTDDAGRLIVLGGHGNSESVTGAQVVGLYNSGWYDDAADGSVTARIQLNGSNEFQDAEPAWVVVGPPAYAHPIFNIVTMFDLAVDVATRLPANRLVLDPICRFTRDIYPVLRRGVDMQWTSLSALGPHGNGGGNFLEQPLFGLLHDATSAGSAAARSHVFGRLKDPANGGSGFFPQNMPALSGLSLTATQYARFRAWRDGDYVDDWSGPPTETPLEQIPIADQPAALTRAALEAGVGGSFQPGIEVASVFSSTATFKAPFRIADHVSPGDLTQLLSVPWQADFAACGTGWWPGGRPNFVMNAAGQRYNWVPGNVGMQEMVNEWNRLGFITPDHQAGTVRYVEEERLF